MRLLAVSIAFVCSVLLTACTGQVVTATRSEPDAGADGAANTDTGAAIKIDASADDAVDAAGFDGPGPPWVDAFGDVWDVTPGCPNWACLESDDYFPPEPLLRAQDVEPDLRFWKIADDYVLAFRGPSADAEPVLVRLPSVYYDSPQVLTFDAAPGTLRVKAITDYGQVLACADDGCRVYAPEHMASETVEPVAPGTVPLPGEPDVVVSTTLGFDNRPCVLGDGAACLYDEGWQVVVEPGSGPRLLDVASLSGIMLFVGEGGRAVFIGPLDSHEEVLDEDQVLDHVTARNHGFGVGPGFVVLGQNPPTVWTFDGTSWSDCPRPLADEFAFVNVFETLYGVRAFGTPYREMMHEGEVYWMDLCPEADALFHGELIDGTVNVCGVSVNFRGLQPDAVLGTMNCNIP